MKFITDTINRGYVNIYGHKVNIIIGDKLLIDGQIGRADCNSDVIYMAESQSEANKKDTMLHEILHFISDRNKLDLTEQQVMILATGLYSIFTENVDEV